MSQLKCLQVFCLLIFISTLQTSRCSEISNNYSEVKRAVKEYSITKEILRSDKTLLNDFKMKYKRSLLIKSPVTSLVRTMTTSMKGLTTTPSKPNQMSTTKIILKSNDKIAITAHIMSNRLLNNTNISRTVNLTIPIKLGFSGSNSSTHINEQLNETLPNIIKELPQYSPAVKLFYKGLKFLPNKNVCELYNCAPSQASQQVAQSKSSPSGQVNNTEEDLMIRCGIKDFLLSKENMTAVNSRKYCCSIDMELAVIEARDEINCLYEFYTNISDKNLKNMFALSFMDHDMKRNFKTCPDKFILPEELWSVNQPNNLGGVENCLVIKFMETKEKSGFDDVSCSTIVNPLCQKIIPVQERNLPKFSENVIKSLQNLSTDYKVPKDVCDDFGCFKDKTKEFNATFMQEIDRSKGLFVANCSKTKYFFLSTSKLNGYQLWDFCCSLGMSPAIINTRDEIQCLDENENAQETFKKSEISFYMSFFDPFWKNDFSSCPDGKAIPQKLWTRNQPDNSNNMDTCVVLTFGAKIINPGYNDVPCYTVNNVMCQYDNKTTLKIFGPERQSTPAPKIQIFLTKTTPSIKQEIPYKFKGLTSVPPAMGLLLICGNKQIYIHRTIVLTGGIDTFCYNLGMSAALIETKEEFNCLRNAYNKSSHVFNLRKGHLDAFFITGYKDVKKDGKFVSRTNQIMPKDLLSPDFQHDFANQCSGLRLHLALNKAKYGSVPCYQRNHLMCQIELNAVLNEKNATGIYQDRMKKN